MTIIFSPDGSLNVAHDPSDLPESGDDRNSYSGAMVRCKNLRLNQKGQAKTRDGSKKLNTSAIEAAIWWIEEQGGNRYAFAGTKIYENESEIESGLTSAQWSAVKYNAFNDTTQQIFALNGTDRKRIESGTVYEWGIAAPTVAPTLSNGQGVGLSGLYNARYTYVRKVGGATVAESNPSPIASEYLNLSNQSLVVDATTPSDAQVTHIRLYRTESSGLLYYRDQDIPTQAYSHGVCFSWEDTDAYLSGESWKFTVTDSGHGTENTYTWEDSLGVETDDVQSYAGNEWFSESQELYEQYMQYQIAGAFAGESPQSILSYDEWLEQNT